MKFLYSEAVKIGERGPLKSRLYVNPGIILSIAPVNNKTDTFKLLLPDTFPADYTYYCTLTSLAEAGIELGGYCA